MKKLINFPVLIRNIWFSLWIVLAILLIMKFCFNTWYPIVVDNKTILSISDYVDNHYILKLCLATPFYIASNYFVCAISTRTKKFLIDKDAPEGKALQYYIAMRD